MLIASKWKSLALKKTKVNVNLKLIKSKEKNNKCDMHNVHKKGNLFNYCIFRGTSSFSLHQGRSKENDEMQKEQM